MNKRTHTHIYNYNIYIYTNDFFLKKTNINIDIKFRKVSKGYGCSMAGVFFPHAALEVRSSSVAVMPQGCFCRRQQWGRWCFCWEYEAKY
jgi:hypothetical protein